MSTSLPVLPLDMLQENELCRVLEVSASEEWRHRLEELGIREGVNLRMVKPGEPSIVSISGKRFSFRCDPETVILVELIS